MKCVYLKTLKQKHECIYKQIIIKKKNMKRKILVVAMVAIALTAGWSFIQNEKKVSLSDIVLNNVEALARNELDEIEVLCNRQPMGEGRCWAVDWTSPIINMHCYRVDDPDCRCVE